MIGKDFSSEDTAATMDVVASPEALSDGYEVSLLDVLTQLAFRKWLIAKVTGIAVLAGVVLALVQPVLYKATTKILPPQQTQSMASMLMMNQLSGVGGGSLASLAGGGLLKNPNDIYIGMLTSRPIADAIIQKFNLANVSNAKEMTAARKALEDSTKVSSEKHGFIEVSVTDSDKKRVAEMANAYPNELRILMKTLAVTEASQRRLYYEEQLKQSKEALVAAELAFQQVQQQKGLVQLDAQARAMIESHSVLRAQVAAKQVQLEALRSYSTEHNPSVQLAESELASLQAEETRMEQRNRTPGIAGLGLGNVPVAGLDYLRAAHELQYQQAMYDMLMKQYDAAKLDESKDAAIIQVVEPAIEPDRKSPQRRLLILLLATFLGFFAGCFLAYVIWMKERALADPQLAGKLENLKHVLALRRSIKTSQQ
jgi:capsule polysaccharide export protein KpsE/RkpR